MTDAIKRIREALADGPTAGPWTVMPASAGEQCVARINAWESVPPNGVELAHDTIDAAFIAACHPEAISELLAELDALKADAERYRWLRGDSCPDHSSRWTQWEVRCWEAPFWTGDLRRADLDDAVDAARGKE